MTQLVEGCCSPEEQRHGIRNRRPNSIDNLQRQTNPVLKASSILVRPLIHCRADELVQQVPMRVMDLNDVESSFECPPRPSNERLHNFLNLRDCQGDRLRESVVEGFVRGSADIRPAILDGADTRTEVQPGSSSGAFPACVGELDANLLILGMREGDDAAPGFDMLVRPDSGVFRRDTTFWEDGSGFYEGKPWSTADNATHYSDCQDKRGMESVSVCHVQCAMCQSVGNPFSAEYWQRGES